MRNTLRNTLGLLTLVTDSVSVVVRRLFYKQPSIKPMLFSDECQDARFCNKNMLNKASGTE